MPGRRRGNHRRIDGRPCSGANRQHQRQQRQRAQPAGPVPGSERHPGRSGDVDAEPERHRGGQQQRGQEPSHLVDVDQRQGAIRRHQHQHHAAERHDDGLRARCEPRWRPANTGDPERHDPRHDRAGPAIWRSRPTRQRLSGRRVPLGCCGAQRRILADNSLQRQQQRSRHGQELLRQRHHQRHHHRRCPGRL